MSRSWSRNVPLCLAVLAATWAFSPAPAGAQQRSNVPTAADRDKAAAIAAPAGQKKLSLVCTLQRPSQIQRFFVVCTGTTQIDVAIADCCIPGDHWQVKVKSWDADPNTAVATAPGPANVFSAPARVFNYGGTPNNKDLKALIECSYLHGVNVFPAGSFINVTSSGTCTSTDLGLEDRIDRTP
jgi:hypothetical protein